VIKPEELALIKGYTVTKEGILLNRNGIQVKGRIKDRKRDYYNFDIRIGPRKETIESIRKDYEDGMSYSNIMIKYNISSKGTVHYIIHKEYTLYKTYPKRYRIL
jgi:hypothetical protein